MGWTYELLTAGDPKWYGLDPLNPVYATEREADLAGGSKFDSWMACTDYRVTAVNVAPTHRREHGINVPINQPSIRDFSIPIEWSLPDNG